MKKFFALVAFCLLIVSCEKAPNLLLPSSEVPDWIQKRISSDEKKIASNPQSGLDVAAWIRYKFQDDYYFEYRNAISSAGPEKYDYNGNKILLTQEPYTHFEAEKCCKSFVWKGPNYIDY
jgi:hypothetical protein